MTDAEDYKYDCKADPYVYPGTSILKNKFDLKDQKLLSTLERQITQTKVLLLSRANSKILNGDFNLKHLCEIHKYLFGDIYDWAGEIRKDGFICKGESIFCYAPLIESYADSIFSKMRLDPFSKMSRSECAQKMAYYLSEVNALHPFREGNGRATRLFFEALAFKHGWQLSLFKIPHKKLQKAMIDSMNKSVAPLSELLMLYISRIDDSQ